MEKKTKILYHDLLEFCESYFGQKGFKLNRQEGLVEKKSPDYSQSIYFDPVWSQFNVYVHPIFFFRLNSIEQIWGKVNAFHGNKDRSTIIVRIEEVDSKLGSFNAKIDSSINLNEYTENLIKFMDEIGWEYMSKLTKISDFDNYCNRPDPNRNDVQKNTFFVWHASPGLIAAKLNHNSLYEALYEKYIGILTHFNNITNLEVRWSNYAGQ
jgi:hypothetical protein